MRFDFELLQSVLGRRADEPEVTALIGRGPDEIERYSYQGYVVFKDYGVSVMFKEAPWVVPPTKITDPKALHLDAFHFHRGGHEGHSQYYGRLPGGIAFDDSEENIVRKLGEPVATGGGGFSTTLKKPIPRWLKYALGSEMLHFQLDQDRKLEMMTLYTPDLQQVQANQ